MSQPTGDSLTREYQEAQQALVDARKRRLRGERVEGFKVIRDRVDRAGIAVLRDRERARRSTE